MTALIVIACILLFFVLLALLKAHVYIEYNGEFVLRVRVLFIKIKILPKKEKKINLNDYTPENYRKNKAKEAEKAKKKQQKKDEKKKQKELEKQQEKLTGIKKPKKTFSDIMDLIEFITDLAHSAISSTFGYLTFKVERLSVMLGGKDPKDTAMIYGAACGGVSNLLTMLDHFSNLTVKKNAVEVIPDFPGNGFSADIKIIIGLRVWQVFGIAIPAALKYLKFNESEKAKKKKRAASGNAKPSTQGSQVNQANQANNI